MSRMMPAAEAAEILGCAESTIEASWRTKDLPAVKYGTSYCMPESAFWEHVHRKAMEHVGAPAAEPSKPAARLRPPAANDPRTPVPAPRQRRSEPPKLPQLPTPDASASW